MSLLEKLDESPSTRMTIVLLVLGIILMILMQILMGIFTAQSGNTVDMFTSQLSFNGEVLKAQYLPMVITGGINAYTMTILLDYAFMIGYGLLIFTILLFVGRLFDSPSNWKKVCFTFAILGLVAAGLDAFENLFILMTLSDPLFFPNWWAVAHSCFALPKWALIFSSMGFAVVAFIKSRL